MTIKPSPKVFARNDSTVTLAQFELGGHLMVLWLRRTKPTFTRAVGRHLSAHAVTLPAQSHCEPGHPDFTPTESI